MITFTDALLGAVRDLRIWQVFVLLAVLFGSGAATYFGYAEVTAEEGLELEETQQIIPVRRGNLINQVSTNGTLTFPEREELTFGSAGRVARVLVVQGELVEQGQPLAELDQPTLIGLQEGAAQAKLDLQEAQLSLESLGPSLELERTTAQEKVANAELELVLAVEALEEAQSPYTYEEIKAQEEKAAAAEVAVRDARETLATLEPDLADLVAQALETKVLAEIALDQARQELEDFKAAWERDLAQAIEDAANARIAWEEARDTLDNYEVDNDAWLDQTLTDLENAEKLLAATQGELKKLETANEKPDIDFRHLIIQWERFGEIRQERVDEIEPLVLDYNLMTAGFGLAEVDLLEARETLAELEEGPDPLQFRDLKAGIGVAEADLAEAELELSELSLGVDPLDTALNLSMVASAEATLVQARADLAEMLQGGDPAVIRLRERQVTLAQASVAEAQRELELLAPVYKNLEQKLREAKVASSKQALADAVTAIEDATLESPIDGLVTLVGVEEGDRVDPETTALEVVATSAVHIDGIVDEIDVLLVTEGTPARVTFDALRGQEFDGAVTEIAPEADTQQGVVTYPITVRVDLPPGIALREGLTAVARIVLDEEPDVLLVPQQALYGSFDEPTVKVLTDFGIEDRAVRLGNSDDFWVSVRSGLTEGDQVIMEGAEINTTGSSFRQLRTITGGRGGGSSRR